MEVSIESPGEIVRRMTIKVPATELEKGVDARIGRFARTAKIPGFRPGKVPHLSGNQGPRSEHQGSTAAVSPAQAFLRAWCRAAKRNVLSLLSGAERSW